MSPSTTTLAWPSLASSPIRRPTPPLPFSRMRLTSSLAMASPCAPCSPITAAAIAPTSFTAFVFTWASNTAALALTRRKPMAKPNASSRPPCASGPTPLTGPTPISATSHSLPGLTTTTSPGLMVAFTTSRPLAALIQVRRLDHLQAPGTRQLKVNGEVAGGRGGASQLLDELRTLGALFAVQRGEEFLLDLAQQKYC